MTGGRQIRPESGAVYSVECAEEKRAGHAMISWNAAMVWVRKRGKDMALGKGH